MRRFTPAITSVTGSGSTAPLSCTARGRAVFCVASIYVLRVCKLHADQHATHARNTPNLRSATVRVKSVSDQEYQVNSFDPTKTRVGCKTHTGPTTLNVVLVALVGLLRPSRWGVGLQRQNCTTRILAISGTQRVLVLARADCQTDTCINLIGHCGDSGFRHHRRYPTPPCARR